MQFAPGMRLRAIVFGLLTTAAACGSGDLGSGGTAGTSGSGTAGATAGTTGGAGTTGTAGGGGDGGSGLPACSTTDGQSHVVEVAIVGSDGDALTEAVTAPVTVTAVAACSAATCPSSIHAAQRSLGSLTTMVTRIVLTAADARTWTLYLRDTAMPDDLIKVNDSFDLKVQAGIDPTLYSTVDQTVVLAHGSDLVVFASSTNHFGQAPLPNLDVFGVQVTDDGAICERAPQIGTCFVRPHAARVTIGTDSASVGSGGTTRIGWLSFTSAEDSEVRDGGGCDSKAHSLMAGFRVP